MPEKVDQVANRKKKGRSGGHPVRHDTELYTDRNTVERRINKLKERNGNACAGSGAAYAGCASKGLFVVQIMKGLAGRVAG